MSDIDGFPTTEREGWSPDNQRPATERDESVGPHEGDRPRTEREGTQATGQGRSAITGGTLLPAALVGRYELLRQYGRIGGEANLFEIHHHESGERRLLKLYLSNIALKRETLERIQAIDDSHVVRLFEFGQCEDGRWYEVQELVSGGDLYALRDAAGGQLREGPLLDVIAELDQALVAFHSADLAHHDIKPDNVLIRQAKPLDLVLADFGLSVVADDDVTFGSNRNATINFQAPETMAKQGGAARDRWAMGLTIASLATGQVPYAGLNEHAILQSHLLRQPPPIVEAVDDDRVRSLCAGLTRFDVSNRWGAEELEEWLDGGSPAVVPDDHPAEVSGHGSVTFNESDYTDRRALAQALMLHDKVARSSLSSGARRQTLLDQIVSAFGNDAIADLDDRWKSKAPNEHVALVELVVALDPTAEPRAHGRELDVAAVGLIAHEAAQGDATCSAIVADLRSQPILEAWGRGAVSPGLAQVERRWRDLLQEVGRHSKSGPPAGVTVPTDQPIAAWALAVAAEASYADALVRLRNEVVGREPWATQDWFRPCANAGADDPAAVIAGLALAPEAHRLDDLRRAELARVKREEREAKRAGWVARRPLLIRVASVGALLGAMSLERAQDMPAGSLLTSGSPLVLVADATVQLGPAGMLLVVGALVSLMFREPRPALSEVSALVAALGGAFALWPAAAGGAFIEGTMEVKGATVLYSLAIGLNGWAFVDSFRARNQRDRVASGGSDEAVARNLATSDRRVVGWAVAAAVFPLAPVGAGLLIVNRSLDGSDATERISWLFEASAWNMLVAGWWRGLWLPLSAGAVALLLRGNWRHRRYGVRALAGLALAAAIAFFYGSNASDSAIAEARSVQHSTPVSGNVVGGFCGRYWTGGSSPTRVFRESGDCSQVRAYRGWFEQWNYRGDQVTDLMGISSIYLVLEDEGKKMTAVDGRSGEQLWSHTCGVTYRIDESQLNQGKASPSNQRVRGTCQGFPFDLDPRTGA